MYGEVTLVEDLSPRMKRITFGGPGLAEFATSGATDEYVNALFIPDGAPYSVPFDVDAARSLDDATLRPRGRRYSIRSHDAASVVIDFVVHGDVGYAGRWANHAQPGDLLQMVGPSGGYHPSPDADWYLMVGDESALPAIARSLEAVPSGVPAIAVVVVDDAASEIDLSSPADLRLRWIHRSAEGDEHGSCADRLVTVLAAIDVPAGEPSVFVHGEAAEVRAVRRHLVADRGIERDGASISPYWRRGQNDEAWREVKRQFVTDMEAER